MTSENRPIPVPPRDDPNRENLSALFDGELHGDAARFAMRRLGHDVQWRDACGRWQLLGDVLRGQASAQAPADFAARVEAALAAEQVGLAALGDREAAPAAVRPRRWRRIGGAALAASVAFIAFLSVRPDLDETASTPPPETVATTPAATGAATASTGPVASVPQVRAPAPAEAPAQPASELGLAAAAVAVAELPRRAGRQSSTRSQAQRAGLRAARETRAPLQVASAAPAGTAVATLRATGEADALHPFMPEAGEIPSRPWPRAGLPDSGAFTASYRTRGYPAGGGEARSFYPFEPRLPQQVEPAGETPIQLREGPRP